VKVGYIDQVKSQDNANVCTLVYHYESKQQLPPLESLLVFILDHKITCLLCFSFLVKMSRKSILALLTAVLASSADARLATQGSSNVAVYWGKPATESLPSVIISDIVRKGQSSGGMVQQNLSTYCAGK
jgi:hypothetical protein